VEERAGGAIGTTFASTRCPAANSVGDGAVTGALEGD
jgi:hypothetical protein